MLREKHRRSNGLKPDFPAECHKTLVYNLKFLTQTYFISFPVCKSSQLILHGSTKIFHPVSLVQSSLFLRCSRFCPTNSHVSGQIIATHWPVLFGHILGDLGDLPVLTIIMVIPVRLQWPLPVTGCGCDCSHRCRSLALNQPLDKGL